MNAQTLRVIKRLESHGFPTVLATELINVLNGTALPPDQMTALVKSLQSHGYTEQMVYDLFLLFNEGTFTQLEINKLTKKFLLVGYNPVIINELINLYDAVDTFEVLSDSQLCLQTGYTQITMTCHIPEDIDHVMPQYYNTQTEEWQNIIQSAVVVNRGASTWVEFRVNTNGNQLPPVTIRLNAQGQNSESYQLTILACEQPSNIVISLHSQSCNQQTGLLTILLNITSSGTDNLFPFGFQVYDEGMGWNEISSTVVGSGNGVFTFVLGSDGYNGQVKNIRVSNSALNSNTLSVPFANCQQATSATINSIGSDGFFDADFSLFRGYDGNQAMSIEYSIDGVSFASISTPLLPSNPYTGNNLIFEAIGTPVLEGYYRIQGMDLLGGLVYSNSFRYLVTTVTINSLSLGQVNISFVNAHGVQGGGEADLSILWQGSFNNIDWNGDTVQVDVLTFPTPATGMYDGAGTYNQIFPYHRVIVKNQNNEEVYSNSYNGI